jgi:hypothetical protein
MSDADLIRAVQQRLAALEKAHWDFDHTDRAKPGDLDAIHAARRVVDQRRDELLVHELARLDALAVQYLHAAPGEWGAGFVAEQLSIMPGGYGDHAVLALFRRRGQELDTLKRLVRNDGRANSTTPKDPPGDSSGVDGSGSTSTAKTVKAAAKGKRINERMLAEMRDHPTESLKRSIRDWADLFGCSTSTVQGTEAWATLQQQREAAKLARQMKDKGKQLGRR